VEATWRRGQVEDLGEMSRDPGTLGEIPRGGDSW
jgi:hypothetical protein